MTYLIKLLSDHDVQAIALGNGSILACDVFVTPDGVVHRAMHLFSSPSRTAVLVWLGY